MNNRQVLCFLAIFATAMLLIQIMPHAAAESEARKKMREKRDTDTSAKRTIDDAKKAKILAAKTAWKDAKANVEAARQKYATDKTDTAKAELDAAKITLESARLALKEAMKS